MKQKSTILLIIILLVAAFLRLYMIGDYMVFLGDEGRDALVVKGILEGNLTLLGPRASAGDFFTGPIYYYMMTPFLWLFQLDPVGPAVMVGLIGVATVYLVFLVGKNFFNLQTGLIAAALYAVAPLVLQYSRSSWNPNVVPFFSLLTIYMLYKAVKAKKKVWRYYLFTGFLLGICVQLHYISLFLGAAVFVSMLIIHWYLHKRSKIFQLIKQYLQVFSGFVIGFAPFLAFEVRHGFPNLQTIFKFVTKDSAEKAYETYNAFYEPIADVFFRIFGRLIFNYPVPNDYDKYPEIALQLFGLVVLIVAIASIVNLFKAKNKLAIILLSVWLVVGVLLFGYYKKPIYDYYLVFIFPLPFFLVGYLLSQLFTLELKKFPYGIIVASLLFVGLIAYNLQGGPFKTQPNKQKDQMKSIAEFVLSKTDTKPFNFALITPGNSDHAYRYFFEVANRKPQTIEIEAVDPDRKTVTDQLMVVCEDVKCKPEGHPLYEIAGFGPARVAGEWSLANVKVFRLVHDDQKKEE